MTSTNYPLSPLAIFITLSFGLIGALPCANAAERIQFDSSIMKSLGINKSVAVYFADSAHFMPGQHTVTVFVNGHSQGREEVMFGKNGELCTDSELLQHSGLIVPIAVPTREKQQCYDYKHSIPTAIINSKPGNEELDIVVPADQLAENDMSGVSKVYDSGGKAGIFNYQAFATKNKYDQSQSTYSQAMLEEGLNFNDWLVRSKEMLVNDDGDQNVDSTYAYLQHTIVYLKKIVQMGQFNITNTPFSGSKITGVQLTPEDNLFGNNGSGVTVSGIAQTSQARVEIRQSGRLIYSTLVPAGPFSLQDIPVTSVNTDLDVTVKETDGSRTHFILPANSFRTGELSTAEGLSFAAGKYQATDGESNEPMLATLSDSWNITPKINVGVGSMLAEDYDAVAITADTLPLDTVKISTELKASNDVRHDNRGESAGLSIDYSMFTRFGVSASMTRYTSGYSELEDSLQDNPTQYSSDYSASLHWNYPSLGAFNLGYSQSNDSDGGNTSRYLNASWGRKFGRFNVNVSLIDELSHDKNKNDDEENSDIDDNGTQVYVNISFPLGEQRITAYTHKMHDSTTSGLQASGDISEGVNYNISAGHDTSENENDFNGSINSNLHYTQMGLSAGENGTDNKNMGVMISGGVVAHDKGVTFSPYQIKDSFAVADIGTPVSGVAISTPSGKVWTDHWGRAIIASLRPYHTSRVEMDTSSLPDNADVDNGYGNIVLGHGAVGKVNFHVAKVHRAMLSVTMKDGSLLRKGTAVVDKQGNYAGTVVDDGILFINDVDSITGLYAQDSAGKNICKINYHLPTQNSNSLYYQKAKGSCL
ncbi:fimbrial biogenesis usher protein [Kluyvera sichuanensis]|uniref:fimbrial biogenesis usher protein n=1 Tax=Kluyvera sichuanensis TaxID=2725494 RepID=UPI0039F59376